MIGLQMIALILVIFVSVGSYRVALWSDQEQMFTYLNDARRRRLLMCKWLFSTLVVLSIAFIGFMLALIIFPRGII